MGNYVTNSVTEIHCAEANNKGVSKSSACTVREKTFRIYASIMFCQTFSTFAFAVSIQ